MGERVLVPTASDAVDILPPASPWKEIGLKPSSGGYLSMYYSDDLSSIPIRWITKPGDNKSDPNLETSSYGLFSTCENQMRTGVVHRGCPYLFFATRRPQGRVLAGYYRMKWYAKSFSGLLHDYALAADAVRFVADPPLLTEVDQRCGTNLARRFRIYLRMSAAECEAVRSYLEKFQDSLGCYLAEIDRVERLSLKHTGFRYPTWRQQEKFTWELAHDYLVPASGNLVVHQVKNSSSTGRWRCRVCGKTIVNRALLRRCPECAAIWSLIDATD